MNCVIVAPIFAPPIRFEKWAAPKTREEAVTAHIIPLYVLVIRMRFESISERNVISSMIPATMDAAST